jgi:excisionase family DNA binding protein
MTSAGAHPHELPRFLTVIEVAAMMRVSQATVYRLLHAGHLPGICSPSGRGPAGPMSRAVSDQFARHRVGDGGVVRGQPGVTRSDAPGSRDRGHRATNAGPGPLAQA